MAIIFQLTGLPGSIHYSVMRLIFFMILSIGVLGEAVRAGDYVPPRNRAPSPAARALSQNYQRDGWRLVGGRWFRPALTVDLSELIVARLVGRELVIEPNISQRVEEQLVGLRKPVVDMIGSTWCWRVDVTGRLWNPDRVTTTRSLAISAVSDEPPPAETVELSSLILRPDSTTLCARGLIDGVVQDVTILLTPSGQFHFIVQSETTDGKIAAIINLEGQNLFELFNGHAEEARRYVRPIFETLFNSPTSFGAGPGDLYRIFSEITPDSSTDMQVHALIDLMDSPDLSQREAAHQQLEQLGDAGVLSLLRMDRSRLRLEARQRVSELIDQATRFPGEDDAALLNNPDFLIDCQYAPDPRVRNLAARRLESLGILIDDSMTFDELEAQRGRIGRIN